MQWKNWLSDSFERNVTGQKPGKAKRSGVRKFRKLFCLCTHGSRHLSHSGWLVFSLVEYHCLSEKVLLCSLSVAELKLTGTLSRIISISGLKLFGLLSKNWNRLVHLSLRKQWVARWWMGRVEGSGLVSGSIIVVKISTVSFEIQR